MASGTRRVAWTLRDQLPAIPIPLAQDDPDAPLDLQTAFTTTYDRAADKVQARLQQLEWYSSHRLRWAILRMLPGMIQGTAPAASLLQWKEYR
ncbi:MAG: DUF4058 family protein [Pirellulales bacterium]|nr:DUF4058 family protein [Pirellulales bacterium]